MNAFEALLGFLLTAVICALLAFLASLLVRTRMSILAYVGAGLIGAAVGAFLAALVRGGDWPGRIDFAGAGVHLLWAFVGSLIDVLIVKLIGRSRR
jgi:uncharacterized membrane protein YeaQ/YmgE (transglycosylase-associated protein family)